jgi:V-type H+-transporting ATPase subunit a
MAMNKLKVENGQYLTGLFWLPKKYAQEVSDTLKEQSNLKYHLNEIS